jgi:hypothetical protein
MFVAEDKDTPEESHSTGALCREMAEDVLLDDNDIEEEKYDAEAVRTELLAPKDCCDAASVVTLQQYEKSLSTAKLQHHCVWEAHLRRVPDNFVPMRVICGWLQQNIEESNDDTLLLTMHEMWLRFCYWYSKGALATADKTFITRSRFGNLVAKAVKGPYCTFRSWTRMGDSKQCDCGVVWMHVHGVRWRASAFPTPSTAELEEQMRQLLSDRRFCLSEEMVERKRDISRTLSPPKKSAKRSPTSVRRPRSSSGSWRR